MNKFNLAHYEVWIPRIRGGMGMIGAFNDWHFAEACARKEAKISGVTLSSMKIVEVHMIRKEVREWTP